jgi:ADP-ribose pyrophosphatase YjhB (NUDIX family)
MPESARHSVSVAAVVVRDDDHVLAIKRADNGHWEPPGGVLELDETIEDGLRREVREETGLDVNSIALTGVYKNMERGIISLVFRCQPVRTNVSGDNEVADHRWLGRNEIQSLMDEAYAIRVFDALDSETTQVRAHDGVHLLEP